MAQHSLHYIETLLEKYEDANTTLQEDAELQAYFLGTEVAAHLEHYKPMFLYFNNAQQEQYTKAVPLHTKNKRSILYKWISVAAVFVLALGIIAPKLLGPSEEEKEALLVYQQTKDALQLLSLGFKKGKTQLNNLALVGTNLQDGVLQANQLQLFNTLTNKILKEKQQ